ncbi:MAG TPA: hypothetical protein VMF11_10270 [Candidatus Baltobacteraceae bacterium]|nr:hypothetical protein [Candidatus Baltobacteraceae bacterium]
MRLPIIGFVFSVCALALAAGCGGSGSGSSTPTTSTTPTPTPTPAYAASGAPATAMPISTSSPASAYVVTNEFGVTVNVQAASAGSGTTVAVSVATAAPAGLTPFIVTRASGAKRRMQDDSTGTPLVYVELQPSAAFTLPQYPQFQLTLPPGYAPQGYNFFAAFQTNDPSYTASTGYNAWYAPQADMGAATDYNGGQTLTWANPSGTFTFGNYYYVYCLYEVSTT